MTQILVTGGCGFIGSHVVKALSEAGEKVVIFDNLYQGKKSNLLHNEELIIGDITDPHALETVFATHQIETVMHFAALVNAAESNVKQEEYKLVNALGSKNVWDAGARAGVKHFLYASSAAVYGTPPSHEPLAEDAPLVPSNPYGETKLVGEQSLREVVVSPMNYLVFRFFNVGGAEAEGRLGQSKASRAIMQRLFATASGEQPTITISGNGYTTTDGTVVRDFVHVVDIATAFVKGLKYLRDGGVSQTINLGGGESHSIGQVASLVKTIATSPINIVYGPAIPGDIDFSLADITKAKRILGWTPEYSLEQIIRDGYRAYVHQTT